MFDSSYLMVGALARLNVSRDKLNQKTKNDLGDCLNLFPSTNLFHNNLAQAIEILHAVDSSIDLIDRLEKIEPQVIRHPQGDLDLNLHPEGVIGIGVIEAPRGTLYYQLSFNNDGTVKKGEIIVPTGQNQIVMEKAIHQLVEDLLTKGTTKEEVVNEVEKLIRVFDPCMSCAAHFLKVNWC